MPRKRRVGKIDEDSDSMEDVPLGFRYQVQKKNETQKSVEIKQVEVKKEIVEEDDTEQNKTNKKTWWPLTKVDINQVVKDEKKQGSGTKRKKKLKEEKIRSRKVTCDRCGEQVRTCDLVDHETKHKTEPEHPCKQCNKVFISVVAFHRHSIRVHHAKLKCETCSKEFTKSDYFIRHLKFGHAEKTFTCDNCDFATPESNQLRMHMEKRHLKNYSMFCNICSKGFFDRSSLKEHENMHTGVKPYQCEVCGMSFKIKCTLRAHKLKFHPHLFPHVCNVCGKGLSTKVGLESHLKLHEEQRKYICDICGKNLNTPRSLLEHRRLHTGERPFQCEVCQKAYPAQKHLIRHMRVVHTAERDVKKHECRHCNRKYSSLSACVSHQKRCQSKEDI